MNHQRNDEMQKKSKKAYGKEENIKGKKTYFSTNLKKNLIKCFAD
jgi:hypothetical protein